MGLAKVVVMIPALNEQTSIAIVIKSVPRKINGVKKVEVLIVDDGSTDNTIEIAKKAGADKVVSHGVNRGLGKAFRTGIDSALEMGADVIVNIDADGQFNTMDIPRLIEPIISGKADVVTCSRFLDKRLAPKMPWVKKFGNNIFTLLVNFLTRKKFTDTQCGFRAYSKEAAMRVTLFGKFTYTQEVLLDLVSKGFEVREVACKVRGEREHGKSRVVSHWWSYGLRALMIIIRTVRDYKPLVFFGSIGALLFIIGGVNAFILWVRLLIEHRIDPFMWMVYMDVIFLILGFLLIMLALIADMSDRQRKIQEETLYLERKRLYGK